MLVMKKILNPIDLSWYADPEARFYDGKYYIYVTQSFTEYERQLNIDMFVSEDLENWEKKTNIVNMEDFPWAVNTILYLPATISTKILRVAVLKLQFPTLRRVLSEDI